MAAAVTHTASHPVEKTDLQTSSLFVSREGSGKGVAGQPPLFRLNIVLPRVLGAGSFNSARILVGGENPTSRVTYWADV